MKFKFVDWVAVAIVAATFAVAAVISVQLDAVTQGGGATFENVPLIVPTLPPDPPRPLVRVGETLAVYVDCLPLPPGQPPCYGEAIKVLEVLPGNWIRAAGEGTEWTINLNRVYALRPHTVGTAAAD